MERNSAGMSFDSSLLESFDKKISPEEYKERILSTLQWILDKRFPEDHIKREIRPHRDRINISCPYCGDSMQSSWKKRGNIILDGKHRNHYKCFNCGEYKRIDLFFKDFKAPLELDALEYVSLTMSSFNYSSKKYDISLLLDDDIIEEISIDREEFKEKFQLIEARSSSIWLWLNDRLQYRGEPFLWHPKEGWLAILNLTKNGKIIGMQRRNFKGWNKYMTYGLPKIYEILGRKLPDNPQVEALSQIFGSLLIDFSKPVTLFEGPLDSFLFPNSIAIGGSEKSFPIEMPLRYFYDDDPAGRKKAIEAIKKGEPVFLWSKFRREKGISDRKKWDLTSLLLHIKEQGRGVPIGEFSSYFSKDPFDIIDI